MAIQKRRIVYMTDEEWATTTSEAQKTHMSASAYIRFAIGHLNLELGQASATPAHSTNPVVTRAVVDSSFTAFRPVPKSGER